MELNLRSRKDRKYGKGDTFYKVIGEATLTSRGKPVDKKRLSGNTLMRREGDTIVVELFGHKILTMHKAGGMTVSSCSYRTKTTKKWLEEFLPSGVGIFSEHAVWYIDTWKPGEYRWNAKARKSYTFTDGMTITERGKVIGAPWFSEKARLESDKLRRRARKFVSDYTDALFRGEVPKPGPGDCWLCCLKTEDGKQMLARDHILGHIDEPYYVPGMLMNAIDEAGGVAMVPRIFQGVMHTLWEKGEVPTGWPVDIAKRHFSGLLLSYVYRRLGFVAGRLPGHLNRAAA